VNEELGLSGVVPFRFKCKRSGQCCKVTGGYAFVEANEVAPMAAARNMDVSSFADSHLRRVSDPETGEMRLALRDGDASRCSLLEGDNHCSIYEARPEHCRQFPHWKSVLSDTSGFARAHAMCPGIEPEVDQESRDRAFVALRALYAEVDQFVEKADPVCIMRGRCCQFEKAGHELYATGLEADFAAAESPVAPSPEGEGRCPYHVKGLCTAREARPLGCRTYFCDKRTTAVLEEAHDHFLSGIQKIEAMSNYPHSYARFPQQMKERGVGVEGEAPQ
jgi:Fe-S-cluster containining protein